MWNGVIYFVLVFSILLIIRNVMEHRKPEITPNIPTKLKVLSENKEYAEYTHRQHSLHCARYLLEIPYRYLVSSDGMGQISRKLSFLATINPDVITIYVDAYLPMKKDRLVRKIKLTMDYTEFFQGRTSPEMASLLNQIGENPFVNSKYVVICSSSTREIEEHAKFFKIELASALGSNEEFVFKKLRWEDELLTSIFKDTIPIKRSRIFQNFYSQITAGPPNDENTVCIGVTPEGQEYCLVWPYDFERHIGIVGPTGSGKTTLLYILIERLVDFKLRINVVDPKGDLVYLIRNSRKLASYNRINVVDDAEKTISRILSEREEQVLVIDEAWKLFSKTYTELYSSVARLFRESRSKGLRIIYSTQNPWDLSSTIFNNTGTIIAFSSSNFTYIRGISEITGASFEALSSIKEGRKFHAIIMKADMGRPDEVMIFTPYSKVF